MIRGNASSLTFRLAWRIVAIFLAAILLSVGVFAWRSDQMLHTLLQQALIDQAQDIIEHLRTEPRGAVSLDLPTQIEEAYEAGGADYLYVVYDRNGHALRSSSSEALHLLAGAVPQGREGFFQFLDPAHGAMHGYVTEADEFRVAVAEPRGEVLLESLVEQFPGIAVNWLVPILVITLVVAFITIRRGLSPLRRLSRDAASIGPQSTGVRLATHSLPGEVAPLVVAVNRALDRLDEGFQAQRRLTADVAHQLRTPLAVLTARIDTLDRTEISLALRRDVERMNRLVEQLLRMARLETADLDLSQPVDLWETAIEVISNLAPIAVAQEVELSLIGAEKPVLVRADGPAVAAALTNLVENALAHAPAGSSVEVEVTADGAVRVLDEGPGIPETEQAAIFERFRRGSQAKTSGTGLGLAIVAETARLHGGRISVRNRPKAGAEFRLSLQPSPSEPG